MFGETVSPPTDGVWHDTKFFCYVCVRKPIGRKQDHLRSVNLARRYQSTARQTLKDLALALGHLNLYWNTHRMASNDTYARVLVEAK